VDVYLQENDGQKIDKEEISPAPAPAQVFVGNSSISVARGDGSIASLDLSPNERVFEIPSLSEAAAVKPPFPSGGDAWFVETRKVWFSCQTLCESGARHIRSLLDDSVLDISVFAITRSKIQRTNRTEPH
jgi:hypothetical protein